MNGQEYEFFNSYENGIQIPKEVLTFLLLKIIDLSLSKIILIDILMIIKLKIEVNMKKLIIVS